VEENNKQDLKKLTFMQYFLVGGSVFAMHFGGSSMLWPMTWGKESGNRVFLAFSGVFITALFLVFIAYLSLIKSKRTILSMASQVSHKYSMIFGITVVLVLGPLFSIPRMSAAAWDALLQVFKFQPKNIIPALIFTVIYYLITYWFISEKGGILDKLSKILLPVLIVSVVAIIIKGIITPLGPQVNPVYEANPFAYGFKGGYATGDVLCALVFGGIIIDDLKYKGIGRKYLNKNTIIVCAIGIGLLTLTHFGHMIVGSHASTIGNLKYSALYSEVVLRLWGQVGGVVFNIALLFAALTTAVGLGAGTANLFCEVLENRVSYKKATAYILVMSAIISIIGLNSIVEIIGPLMDVVYPSAVVMILYYTIMPDLESKPKILAGYKTGTTTALVYGVLEGIVTYGNLLNFNVSWLENIILMIPGSSLNIGWVVVVIVASVIAMLLHRDKKVSTT
jgi:LIVCS family branched-chain amino acid:cation transporter